MTIDLPVGTKVKLGGKHCIVTPIEEDEDKDYLCINHCGAAAKGILQPTTISRLGLPWGRLLVL